MNENVLIFSLDHQTSLTPTEKKWIDLFQIYLALLFINNVWGPPNQDPYFTPRALFFGETKYIFLRDLVVLFIKKIEKIEKKWKSSSKIQLGLSGINKEVTTNLSENTYPA